MKNQSHNISLPDYHIHTPLCKHAEGAPELYRAEAGRTGLPEICFSDHAPSVDGYDREHRMALSQFDEYIKMVSKVSQGDGPRVMLGIEADYYRGCEDFLSQWLPSQDFDLVIGSVHFIDAWGFDNPHERHIWDSVDIRETWQRYFKLLERLADTRLYDVVGHMDIPKKFGHRPTDKDITEMVQPALDRIAEAGMGIELNTAGLRKPVGEIYPSALILSIARERGIPICFGSDAHKPEEVGFGFKEALELARSVGYTEHFTVQKRKKKMKSLPEL
jgi:histidinol-phosphatase (PHP family)